MRSPRAFAWLSALDDRNGPALHALARQMAAFYSGNDHYYSDVSFTRDNWRDNVVYRHIAELVRGSESILEAGCGEANLLHHHPSRARGYHGLDFSADLLTVNR